MSASGETVITVTRIFDFPRESVFSMFIEPKKAAKWWGPEGNVTLEFELDPRPGGSMKIVDRLPDGDVFRTSGTVTEIVVPELLAFRSSTVSGADAAPWEAHQTVTFEALGPRKTRVTALVKVFAVGAWRGDLSSLANGFKGGWGESFDRLRRALGQ